MEVKPASLQRAFGYVPMHYPTLNSVKPTELNNTVPIKPLQETLPSYLTEIYPIVRSRGASLTRLGNTKQFRSCDATTTIWYHFVLLLSGFTNISQAHPLVITRPTHGYEPVTHHEDHPHRK